MKITAIRGIMLRCTCSPISDALSTSTARQALLVKIETDAGLYGIGEAFTYGAPLKIMKYLVEEQLGPMLIGQDPTEIEKHWNTMYWRTIAHGRRSMTMGAMSGIDIALWDLLGKAAHMPVCKLLGQHLDRVPSYASGGFYAPGKDLHKLEEELEHYKDQGYRDMKIKIGRTLERSNAPLTYMANQACAVSVEEDYKRIEVAKQIVGSGKLLVDTNASWDAQTALSFAPELARLGVAWLEEPIPFEDIEGMKKLNAAVPQLHWLRDPTGHEEFPAHGAGRCDQHCTAGCRLGWRHHRVPKDRRYGAGDEQTDFPALLWFCCTVCGKPTSGSCASEYGDDGV
jgi:D-galactarolactone cycloisomerase